jgi:hypothetical protein
VRDCGGDSWINIPVFDDDDRLHHRWVVTEVPDTIAGHQRSKAQAGAGRLVGAAATNRARSIERS